MRKHPEPDFVEAQKNRGSRGGGIVKTAFGLFVLGCLRIAGDVISDAVFSLFGQASAVGSVGLPLHAFLTLLSGLICGWLFAVFLVRSAMVSSSLRLILALFLTLLWSYAIVSICNQTMPRAAGLFQSADLREAWFIFMVIISSAIGIFATRHCLAAANSRTPIHEWAAALCAAPPLLVIFTIIFAVDL